MASICARPRTRSSGRRVRRSASCAPIRSPAPPPPPTGPADRAPAESSTDIAGTWTRYQQLVSAGIGPASLEELIKGSPPGPAARGNGDPVDIRTLLYKGARARARVQELREAAKRTSGDALRAIIDEVCDLVVLAIEPE